MTPDRQQQAKPTTSDERLMELLELYHGYSHRLYTAKYRFNEALREVERRGLEIPDWVYDSPYLHGDRITP